MLRSAFLLARLSALLGLCAAGLLVAAAALNHPDISFQNLKPVSAPVAWRTTETNQEKLLKEAAVTATMEYSQRIAEIPRDFRVEQFNATLRFAIVSVDYDKRHSIRFLVHGQSDGRWSVIAAIIGWRFTPIGSA